MFVGVLLIARRLPLARRISLSLLIPYVFMMAVFTVLLRVPSAEREVMLTPLASFREALTSDFWYFEIKGNILLFIPFGFLLSMVVKRLNGIPLLAGFLFSAMIESMQYFTHRGVFETDDLITNFIGTLIGFVMCIPVKLILDACFSPKKKKEK